MDRGGQVPLEGSNGTPVEVYSKKGCRICDAAKDKLERLGVLFRTFDLQEIIAHHSGWREDGSIEVLAAYAMIDNRMPVIRIGGEFHDYPGAMRRLKAVKKRGSGDPAVAGGVSAPSSQVC